MIDKKKLFDKMEAHLLKDDVPSEYFNHVSEKEFFREYPFSLLYRLKETPQSPKYHPEGNVWNHTMLVLDEAASCKDKSVDQRAFLWAALLHDIGKASTTKNNKGKITAYNHEKVGASLAEDFLKEFLYDPVLIRKIVSLIRWHMQILFVIKSMQFADVKTMLKETDLDEVALLGYCDRMGRTNADKEAEIENLNLFMEICKKQHLQGKISQ